MNEVLYKIVMDELPVLISDSDLHISQLVLTLLGTVMDISPNSIRQVLCSCMYMHVHVYVYMCACVHVCMCACVHVCMCACVHVCVHVCVHACMYMYMYSVYSCLRPLQLKHSSPLTPHPSPLTPHSSPDS